MGVMGVIVAVTDPQSGYLGIDVAQIIFGGLIIMILVGFGYWGWMTRNRIQKLEESLRDFRELEPEGFDEESEIDPLSEGARLDADESLARQRDIMEHGGSR